MKTATRYRLYVLAGLFVLGQLFFFYKGVETLPFYNYGMYSAPIAAKDTFQQLEIYIDGQAWNYHRPTALAVDFIESQLDFYNNLERHDFKDPVRHTVRRRFGENSAWEPLLINSPEVKQAFPEWLGRYLKARGQVESGQKLALKRCRYIYQAGYPQRVACTEVAHYAVD